MLLLARLSVCVAAEKKECHVLPEQVLPSKKKSSAAVRSEAFGKRHSARIKDRVVRQMETTSITAKSHKQQTRQNPMKAFMAARALIYPKKARSAKQQCKPAAKKIMAQIAQEGNHSNQTWDQIHIGQVHACQGCRELKTQIQNQAKSIADAVADIEQLRKLVNVGSNHDLSLQENETSEQHDDLAEDAEGKNHIQQQKQSFDVGQESEHTRKPLQRPQSQCENDMGLEETMEILFPQSTSNDEELNLLKHWLVQTTAQDNASEQMRRWADRVQELEGFGKRLKEVQEKEAAKSDSLSQRLKNLETCVRSNEAGLTLAEKVKNLEEQKINMFKYHGLLRRLLLLDNSTASSAEFDKLRNFVAKLDQETAKLTHFDRLVRRGDQMSESVNQLIFALPSLVTVESAAHQSELIRKLEKKVEILQTKLEIDKIRDTVQVSHKNAELPQEANLHGETLPLHPIRAMISMLGMMIKLSIGHSGRSNSLSPFLQFNYACPM